MQDSDTALGKLHEKLLRIVGQDERTVEDAESVAERPAELAARLEQAEERCHRLYSFGTTAIEKLQVAHPSPTRKLCSRSARCAK